MTAPLHTPVTRGVGSAPLRRDLANWQGSRRSIPLPGNGEGSPCPCKTVQVGKGIERRNGEGRLLDCTGGSGKIQYCSMSC